DADTHALSDADADAHADPDAHTIADPDSDAVASRFQNLHGSPTPKPAIDRKIHHATDPGLQRLLFKKGSGVLKKVSPNSYMLYRLDHIKSYKGKKISANDINAYITNEWNSLPQEVKNVYKLRSAVLQDLLDKLNYKSNLAEAATSPASSDLMAAPKLESLALPSRMERAYYLAP
ncbi:hypothetical protein IWQ56_001908, partial [Coemansia nantahalensis]